ncbi:zinc-binding dehydrogenase [Ochrobactrum haematophilum]|uniref:Zinc-binding dehydrogenase n=2 Tax=Brucella haematophila TaxID=419474 RepID=A0ABX1DR36_9HYPH|nr:zinc-binding dehydrogenase [Brucella haematophila]
MMLSGQQARMMAELSPPYVGGMEFSGHVHEVGEGVNVVAKGDAVIGVVNPRRPEGGAQAAYVRVPAASVAKLKPEVDLVSAATVPMNALTAHMTLDLLSLQPGQSVLVTGGSGMLGGSVIQLARRAGLHVVATGSTDDWPLLRSLGADTCVSRDEAGMVGAVREAFPEGVDGLVDGALIGNNISFLVRDGGTAVSLRITSPIEDKRLKTPYVSVIAGMERTDILDAIASGIEERAIVPRVAEGGRFSFKHAADAYRMALRGGFRGRVVLLFDDAVASD